MHDKILDMLLQRDEITWQSIILDLVKSEEIDPWDIDISLLSQKYLETVRKLKEANLFISGKVLLASAILLKIKSERLLSEDFVALDNLLFPPENMEELDQYIDNNRQSTLLEHPKLTIKTPQARKKKVTVDDLLEALDQALSVNERRLLRTAERNRVPENMVIPERAYDITLLIEDLYKKLFGLSAQKEVLTFTEVLPSNQKQDKLLTFSPLLHLSNQERIDLDQKEHFGEIYIKVMQKK